VPFSSSETTASGRTLRTMVASRTAAVVEVGAVEAVGVLVVDGPDHAGVAVAEEMMLVDAEDRDRIGELTATVLDERHVTEVDARQVLPRLPAGAGHDDGPHPFGDRPGEDPSTGDRLVVGMGMDAQQDGHRWASSGSLLLRSLRSDVAGRH
jgi:hypothetical protein